MSQNKTFTQSTEELVALRTETSQAYYSGDTEPLLSDEEFDALLVELRSRGVEDVPGHGYVPDKTLEKVTHEYEMQSLEKVHSSTDIDKWFKKMPAGSQMLIQPKYDGFALNITYDHEGNFIQGATRGNHKVGEDVTRQVQMMIDSGIIPATIDANGHGGNTHVRGEAYISYEDFAKLQELTDGSYKSIRNTAPGLVRRGNPELLKFVSFVAYDTNNYETDEVESLEAFGFSTPTAHFYKKAKTAKEAHDFVQELGITRFEEFDFDTDGAVIKLEATFDERNDIGTTSNHPRWAIAYKYPEKPQTTVIRDVLWSHKRTGKLTPVAVFDQVVLTGNAKTTRASLANYAKFNTLSLRPGDSILVIRANGVIPFIVGLDPKAERSTENPFQHPEFYPTEEYPTHLTATGKELMVHQDAPLPVASMVENSVKILDLKGVGISFIEEMLESGLAENFLDMLDLSVEDIDKSRGKSGENTKSAQASVEALQSAFEKPLAQWIGAIGIKGIATSRPPVLEQHYKSLDALSEAKFEEVIALDKFNGSVHAQTLVDNRHLFKEWADRLRAEHNFVPKPNEVKVVKVAEGGIDYTGKTVVVTGTFPTMGRKDVEAWVKEHGGKIGSSVSGKTDILIYGEKAGSKLEKAQSVGTVKLVTAEEFEDSI